MESLPDKTYRLFNFNDGRDDRLMKLMVNTTFNGDFKCEEIVIGADFNLTLDVEKDKKGGLARTHKKSLEPINSFSENLDLIDAWRVLNPESSRFTWRQRKPEIHRRLDFFLINQCTFCNIIDAEILAGYKTDHSMITLQISLHSNTRG